MILVDSHCHLQDERFLEDIDEVLERALAELAWLVVVGDDLSSSKAAVALARERVYATVGVHPYHGATVDDTSLADLCSLAANSSVVAIGETGLDYFKYCETPRDVQRQGFARQTELACKLGLPVVVHNRDSDEDCLAVLGEFEGRLPGCVMHCFGSDAAFAARCADRGYYISFAGNVTFPKAQPLRDAAAAVPLGQLLVETDAPYLAPQEVRGKRCEPQYVRYTAELLAKVKGVDVDTLAEHTARNAAAVFGLDV